MRMSFAYRFLPGSLLMLFALVGCAAVPRSLRLSPAPASASTPRMTMSKAELQDLLEQYVDTFEATIQQATDQLITLQPDSRTRRLALLWQMRLIPLADDAIAQGDALRGLLDVWTLCVRMQVYFTSGDGRALFGSNQALAQQAAERCVRDIEHVAETVLPSADVAPARTAVAALAAKYPLRGEFSGGAVRTAVQHPDKGDDVLQSVLSLPLAPFRAFEGVDRGAAAIQEFTAVAARMTNVVQGLPNQARLQSELLLMEAEELDTVRSARTSFEQLAAAAQQLAARADSLPDELRCELTVLLDEFDSRQTNLQTTLRTAGDVARTVSDTLTQVQRTAQTVDQTAGSTAIAGQAWTGTFQSLTDMVASFRGPPTASSPSAAPSPAPQPADTSAAEHPFDINDYTRTAEALDHAAVQLQKLTADVRDAANTRELSGAIGALDQHVRELVELSQGRAQGLADHVAWRAGQLIVLSFVLVVLYRLAIVRFVRKPAT